MIDGLASRRLFDRLPPGPVAVVFAEDGCELASTLDRCWALGFAATILFRPESIAQADRGALVQIDRLVRSRADAAALLSGLHRRLAGRWLAPLFNSEYLFYPYCETRSIKDFTGFMEEERRSSVFGVTIDLYAEDLGLAPDGVLLEAAGFDALGYYGFSHEDAAGFRQADLHGGLRWRFAERIPSGAQHLDRPALYMARSDLVLDARFRFSQPSMNALSCPWHRNPTAAILSFRTVRALLGNPASARGVEGFVWEGTQRCAWRSEQLMQLGFMEPGQWF